MKFVIRDDDLNFFSHPTDIEHWYTDIFAQNIPVGFATIPFVKGNSDVYTNLVTKDKNEYAISKNTELVSYIRNNPLIEIIQHGTTHETKDGSFEYGRNGELINSTKRGKEELERAFNRSVHVFAPPHDWINNEGITAVEMAKMNIIRGRGAGLRNFTWRISYALIFLRMLVYRFPKYISMIAPVYPYVLNFGRHKEACSYRLEDQDIFEGLKYTSEKNGVFVVVVHLHFFNKEKKARLLELIKKGREYGADFVMPSAIF